MSELQHPDSRSFEQVAELYERARPEYPDELLAWVSERLDLGPGGYASAPSTETRRGVTAALRKKLRK